MPKQKFTTDPQTPPEAISALKALNLASAQGQQIYEITPTNQATVSNNIHHDSATMTEIRASLTVGKTIITHTDPVSVPGYTGAGYIILDPETGEGAYKISGGSNGSFYLGVLAGLMVLLGVLAILALIIGSAGFAGAAVGAMFAAFPVFINNTISLNKSSK